MTSSRPLVPSLILLAACGARVAGGDDGGAPGNPVDATSGGDAGGSHDATVAQDGAQPGEAGGTTPHDAGTDCGQPPQPTYACGEAEDAGHNAHVCHDYGADAGAGGPTYPIGCTVTLTMCNASFGGAQTCNCQTFPGNGPTPTWVCPL